MDVTEAFLNDPYDWEGPKDTHVTATEADMDGEVVSTGLAHGGGQELDDPERQRDLRDLVQHPNSGSGRLRSGHGQGLLSEMRGAA